MKRLNAFSDASTYDTINSSAPHSSHTGVKRGSANIWKRNRTFTQAILLISLIILERMYSLLITSMRFHIFKNKWHKFKLANASVIDSFLVLLLMLSGFNEGDVSSL